MVIGVSADGTTVYVVAEDANSSRTGCEGLPEHFLFAVPLDGAPRRLVAPEPLSGRFVRSPDGSRVAIMRDCEEQFDGLFIASELPGGKLSDVRRVAPKSDLRPMPSLGLSWSADGQALLAVAAKPPQYDETRTVIRIDIATGAVNMVRRDRQAIAAAELADGTLVVLSSDRLRIGPDTIAVRGDALAVAPDGRQIAVYGPAGLTLVRRGERPVRLASTAVNHAAWSSDSTAIATTGDAVRVVTTDGTATRVGPKPAGGILLGPAIFTPDGSGLVYTREKPAGDRPYGPPFATLVPFHQ